MACLIGQPWSNLYLAIMIFTYPRPELNYITECMYTIYRFSVAPLLLLHGMYQVFSRIFLFGSVFSEKLNTGLPWWKVRKLYNFGLYVHGFKTWLLHVILCSETNTVAGIMFVFLALLSFRQGKLFTSHVKLTKKEGKLYFYCTKNVS